MNLESARRKSGRRPGGKEKSLEEKAKEARASAAGGVGSPLRLGPAYPELVETCYSSWSGLEGEGAQYEYWNGKVTKNSSANDCLKKYQAKYQATSAQPTYAYPWWERSVYPTYATIFAIVTYTGYPSGNSYASSTNGVCPCFCLVVCRSSTQCARRRRENPGEEETP